jgi:hypothetical protein
MAGPVLQSLQGAFWMPGMMQQLLRAAGPRLGAAAAAAAAANAAAQQQQRNIHSTGPLSHLAQRQIRPASELYRHGLMLSPQPWKAVLVDAAGMYLCLAGVQPQSRPWQCLAGSAPANACSQPGRIYMSQLGSEHCPTSPVACPCVSFCCCCGFRHAAGASGAHGRCVSAVRLKVRLHTDRAGNPGALQEVSSSSNNSSVQYQPAREVPACLPLPHTPYYCADWPQQQQHALSPPSFSHPC